MMPIAPLMIEHRLIERMIKVMKSEIRRIDESGKARPDFIDLAVDFIRTYADRCHHGKEEGILFARLSEKSISDQLRRIMEELIEEHVSAREMTNRLVAVRDRYVMDDGAALGDIRSTMQTLVTFYPVHIEKEDRHFFVPSMGYFDNYEQDDMAEAFAQFDRTVVHEKYRSVVERFESGK